MVLFYNDAADRLIKQFATTSGISVRDWFLGKRFVDCTEGMLVCYAPPPPRIVNYRISQYVIGLSSGAPVQLSRRRATRMS